MNCAFEKATVRRVTEVTNVDNPHKYTNPRNHLYEQNRLHCERTLSYVEKHIKIPRKLTNYLCKRSLPHQSFDRTFFIFCELFHTCLNCNWENLTSKGWETSYRLVTKVTLQNERNLNFQKGNSFHLSQKAAKLVQLLFQWSCLLWQ